MGECQTHMGHWNCMDDVIQFALSLPKTNRTALLLVVSAIIWTIWNQRNHLCFRNSVVHSCRNVILNIVSLVAYWTGRMTEEIQVAVNAWMPQDLDEVPLQVVHPAADQMVEWVSSDST